MIFNLILLWRGAMRLHYMEDYLLYQCQLSIFFINLKNNIWQSREINSTEPILIFSASIKNFIESLKTADYLKFGAELYPSPCICTSLPFLSIQLFKASRFSILVQILEGNLVYFLLIKHDYFLPCITH